MHVCFRNFVFSPEVPIRIDYEGKHVDLTHGPLAGLLMGLGQLNCLQIKLKRLSYKHGYDEIFRLKDKNNLKFKIIYDKSHFSTKLRVYFVFCILVKIVFIVWFLCA